MKIGTIGAGYIARAVATKALANGHEVMVSNSRDPKSLFSFKGALGCEVGTPSEAAEFGDLVLVAVPLFAYESVPVEPLSGKVVMDSGNYYPQRDGSIIELDSGALSTSEFVARRFSESKLVRVFNAIVAADIEDAGRPLGSPDRIAQPIAGDDGDAKRVVTGLLEEFGFDVVDAGPLAEGRRFEKDTPAYCVRLDESALRDALAAA
jgi:predicted dinucleotide-binding enzyme